jgi:hypothetical protein
MVAAVAFCGMGTAAATPSGSASTLPIAIPSGSASPTATPTDTTVPTTTATPTNLNNFSLSAEGDGYYLAYSSQGIPAVPSSYVSPYAAQSKLGSGGNSASFAGLPYLGPQIQTLAGLVGGLSQGRTPPIPPVPGYAASSYPATPAASESNGPYFVQAASNQYDSSATAALGLGGTGTSAGNQQIFSKSSVVANNDGSVEATASAGVDGLDLAGVINALDVSTSEDLSIAPDGTVTHTSSEDLGSFSILGFKIGIDAKGFEVLGGVVTLPTNTVLDQVNKALKAAGIAIGVLPETVTMTDGQISEVTSGALEVKLNENVPALGPTTVDQVFGRSSVTATDVGAETSTSGASSAPTDSTGGTEPSTGSDTGSIPGGSVSLPPVTLPDGSGTSADQAPVIAPQTVAQQPIEILGNPTAFDIPGTGHFAFTWYLAIVLAGVGIVVGSQVFRAFGVRLMVNDA